MNQFYHQKNAFAALEETRGFSDQRESVVCPKPRRFGVLANNNTPIRSLRWQLSHPAEISDSKAGAELLDIILMKEGYGAEQSAFQVASSPPFFSGSPPSRSANPLVQDVRFRDEKFSPTPLQVPSPSGLSSPSSSARKAGCARMNFGLKPATVRIEGFDCLNRDRQNASIPAVA